MRRGFEFTATVLLVLAIPAQGAAQVLRVAELNTEQIRELDRERTVVLLPAGVLEEHGPYLPSFTDGLFNEWLTERLAEAVVARPGWTALVFPTIPLGVGSPEQFAGVTGFDGSYTVRPSTLRAVFMDLGSALGEAGFRWVFVLHAHGPLAHNRVLHEAGEFFRDTFAGHMVHLTGYAVGAHGDGRVFLTDDERAEEGMSVHGGVLETSRTLFMRPDLVAPGFRAAPPQTARVPEDLPKVAGREDWPGYFGSPRLARPDIGAKYMIQRVEALIEFALSILDGRDYSDVARRGAMGGAPAAFQMLDETILGSARRWEEQQERWLRERGIVR